MIIVKKPKIRFKGFTETWEQRKLGTVATFINGRAYSQDELQSSGKYRVLRVGNLYTNYSWYYSDMELEDKYYAISGDLLYTWSATFGPHIWLGEKIIYHYHIWKVVLSSTLDKSFAVHLLERDKQEILSDKNGSTMVHITKKGMEEKEVILPTNIDEQIKIGKQLDAINNLITLHQRKCENLKKFKKFMLQKLFPQNGENVPKVRFLNFTDTWEQRKLFDFTFFYNGLTYTPDDVRENGTLVLRSSNVKHSEIVLNDNVYVDPIKVNSEYVKKGDIIIVVRNGSRALIGKHAVIKDEMPNTVIGAFMSGIRSQYSFFVNSLLDTSQFKEEILRNLGATINQITGYMFSKMEFMIPSCYEQKMIGDYFSKLDNLITLHQSKCDKLKEVKKYMLQNMFI